MTEDNKDLWQVRVLKQTALKNSSEDKKVVKNFVSIAFARHCHENYEGI